MTQEIPSAGNATGLPLGTLDRLAQFEEWTGIAPPSQILDEDGAPSLALTAFCKYQGLSLDWIFRGDARGSILRAHRAAGNHILHANFEDDGEDEVITMEAQLVALLLRADAKQRQIIKSAAIDRLSGQPLGDVLWRMCADLDSYRTLSDHPKTKGRA